MRSIKEVIIKIIYGVLGFLLYPIMHVVAGDTQTLIECNPILLTQMAIISLIPMAISLRIADDKIIKTT